MELFYSLDFPDIDPPSYAHEGDAGFDIRAAEDAFVTENDTVDVKTGLRFMIPPGFELQLRPRSGLSRFVTLANSPATIDSGYRGEIIVRLLAHGGQTLKVRRGDRIAQAVFAPVYRADLQQIANISTETPRGEGGFGSTGVS